MASSALHDLTEDNLAAAFESAPTTALSEAGNNDESTTDSNVIQGLVKAAKDYEGLDWDRVPDY